MTGCRIARRGPWASSRRSTDSCRMDQVIPWAQILALIEPHYPRRRLMPSHA